MKQIALICGVLAILLVAIVGCMVIFNVVSMEYAKAIVLRFGAAIVLLGVCSALASLLMGGGKSPPD